MLINSQLKKAEFQRFPLLQGHLRDLSKLRKLVSLLSVNCWNLKRSKKDPIQEMKAY